MKTLKTLGLACLGLVCVLALIVAGLAGVAHLQTRSDRREQRVTVHEIPARPEVPTAGTPAPNHVVLELSHAEFRIEAGRPGDPMRVDATYDPERFALEERFEPATDGSWTYRVSCWRIGSGLMENLRRVWGQSMPSVVIQLPPDAPMRLELQLVEGTATAELGGLRLTEADLAFHKGALEVRVASPLAEPIERLALRGSMGGLSVSDLGNASPRELTVDFSMGGMELGLGGTWMRDASISVSTRMGGGSIRLPDDVVVSGLDTGFERGTPDRELKLPTLRFDVHAAMGDVHVLDASGDRRSIAARKR